MLSCRIFLVVVAIAHVAAHQHPQHLTHVGDGVFAAGLSRSGSLGTNKYRRLNAGSSAFQGERLGYAGLGAYKINVLISGLNITATLDTGSGICIVACTGDDSGLSVTHWHKSLQQIGESSASWRPQWVGLPFTKPMHAAMPHHSAP